MYAWDPRITGLFVSSPFYTLDSEFLAAFRMALSPERLGTYLRHTNGDQVLALRLYTSPLKRGRIYFPAALFS